jgi:uncharacterized protein YlxP (DUF503 family)
VLVAGCSWDLSLPECRSLKDKRRVVKSLKDRIRGRFNVSVAETAYQDVWTRAQLSVVLVTTNGPSADSVLDRVDHFIEREHRVVILSANKARY